jgi:hypothetical protein
LELPFRRLFVFVTNKVEDAPLDVDLREATGAESKSLSEAYRVIEGAFCLIQLEIIV